MAPVALITGASRGIGKQLAIDLAHEGYDIVLAARSSSDSPSKLPGTIDKTAELVEAKGRQAMRAPIDVRDELQVAELAGKVYNEWGRCDLLVNNAAVAPPGWSLEEPVKRWRLAVDVNVNGPFYLTYYFAPRMAAAGEGRVINVSSSAAVTPEFGRASYTVTKRALEALTECHAHELRGKVAVNTFRIDMSVWSEGYTDTLGEGDYASFEDPVICSDAVLWMAKQPIDHTGHLHILSEMREQGIVRPPTTAEARAKG